MDKAQLLDRMDTAHSQMEQSGVVDDWSLKDLLAHMVDWEQRSIGWYWAGQRGDEPEVPALGMGWEDIDDLNRRIYERHRRRPLEEVLADFRDSYQEVRELVSGIPEDEMFAVGCYTWMGKGNLVGFILANTFSHYRWAKTNIRKWVKEIDSQ
jgi:hypothetical protein